jgi:DNA primase
MNHQIDELKQVNILDLAKHVGFTVVERGNKYTTEEHDSLVLYPDSNSWFRFSDDKGGDPISFLMYWTGVDFKRACEQLENMAGVLPAVRIAPVTQAPAPELPQDQHLIYHRSMRPAERAWWIEHYGVSDTAINYFSLGACREGRFAPVTYTIPIFNDGKLVNIKHRIPNAPHSGKYRSHQSGVGTQLFNGDRLTPDCKGVVIVAGEMKAITLEDWGIPAVSPTGGCGNWKDEWTTKLQYCERVYVAFDPEPPEEREHALKLLAKLDRRARMVETPQKPDDFINAKGVEAFRELLRNARTLTEVKAWDAALDKARRTVRI